MIIDANPSSGHQDKDSYDEYVLKYEAFIKGCEEEGCRSSPSRVQYRSPLQLALLISPLFLLLTTRLFLKSYHRRTLIDVAAKLGPRKPPLILKVENLIWDAVFKLSEGHHEAHTVLLELAESLPWTEINGSLNPGTEGWFNLESCMLSLF